MLLYAIPSIFNLIFKSILLWKSRSLLYSSSTYFKTFFIGLWFLNLIELISFGLAPYERSFYLGIASYYFFINISLFSLILLALEKDRKIKKSIEIAVLTTFIIATTPLFIPGTVLEGSKSIGYSITRIPGPYYFITQLSMILPLMFAIGTLIYRIQNKNKHISQRAKALLYSCCPIFLAMLLVVALMHMGYKINATIIASSMITLTIFMLIHQERKYGYFQFIDRAEIFKITSLLPKTKEHLFVKNITQIISNPNIGLTEGRELIEKEMIEEALNMTDGNKEKAAKLLGISRQTLQRLRKN